MDVPSAPSRMLLPPITNLEDYSLELYSEDTETIDLDSFSVYLEGTDTEGAKAENEQAENEKAEGQTEILSSKKNVDPKQNDLIQRYDKIVKGRIEKLDKKVGELSAKVSGDAAERKISIRTAQFAAKAEVNQTIDANILEKIRDIDDHLKRKKSDLRSQVALGVYDKEILEKYGYVIKEASHAKDSCVNSGDPADLKVVKKSLQASRMEDFVADYVNPFFPTTPTDYTTFGSPLKFDANDPNNSVSPFFPATSGNNNQSKTSENRSGAYIQSSPVTDWKTLCTEYSPLNFSPGRPKAETNVWDTTWDNHATVHQHHHHDLFSPLQTAGINPLSKLLSPPRGLDLLRATREMSGGSLLGSPMSRMSVSSPGDATKVTHHHASHPLLQSGMSGGYSVSSDTQPERMMSGAHSGSSHTQSQCHRKSVFRADDLSDVKQSIELKCESKYYIPHVSKKQKEEWKQRILENQEFLEAYEKERGNGGLSGLSLTKSFTKSESRGDLDSKSFTRGDFDSKVDRFMSCWEDTPAVEPIIETTIDGSNNSRKTQPSDNSASIHHALNKASSENIVSDRNGDAEEGTKSSNGNDDIPVREGGVADGISNERTFANNRTFATSPFRSELRRKSLEFEEKSRISERIKYYGQQENVLLVRQYMEKLKRLELERLEKRRRDRGIREHRLIFRNMGKRKITVGKNIIFGRDEEGKLKDTQPDELGRNRSLETDAPKVPKASSSKAGSATEPNSLLQVAGGKGLQQGVILSGQLSPANSVELSAPNSAARGEKTPNEQIDSCEPTPRGKTASSAGSSGFSDDDNIVREPGGTGRIKSKLENYNSDEEESVVVDLSLEELKELTHPLGLLEKYYRENMKYQLRQFDKRIDKRNKPKFGLDFKGLGLVLGTTNGIRNAETTQTADDYFEKESVLGNNVTKTDTGTTDTKTISEVAKHIVITPRGKHFDLDLEALKRKTFSDRFNQTFNQTSPNGQGAGGGGLLNSKGQGKNRRASMAKLSSMQHNMMKRSHKISNEALAKIKKAAEIISLVPCKRYSAVSGFAGSGHEPVIMRDGQDLSNGKSEQRNIMNEVMSKLPNVGSMSSFGRRQSAYLLDSAMGINLDTSIQSLQPFHGINKNLSPDAPFQAPYFVDQMHQKKALNRSPSPPAREVDFNPVLKTDRFMARHKPIPHVRGFDDEVVTDLVEQHRRVVECFVHTEDGLNLVQHPQEFLDSVWDHDSAVPERLKRPVWHTGNDLEKNIRKETENLSETMSPTSTGMPNTARTDINAAQTVITPQVPLLSQGIPIGNVELKGISLAGNQGNPGLLKLGVAPGIGGVEPAKSPFQTPIDQLRVTPYSGYASPLPHSDQAYGSPSCRTPSPRSPRGTRPKCLDIPGGLPIRTLPRSLSMDLRPMKELSKDTKFSLLPTRFGEKPKLQMPKTGLQLQASISTKSLSRNLSMGTSNGAGFGLFGHSGDTDTESDAENRAWSLKTSSFFPKIISKATSSKRHHSKDDQHHRDGEDSKENAIGNACKKKDGIIEKPSLLFDKGRGGLLFTKLNVELSPLEF